MRNSTALGAAFAALFASIGANAAETAPAAPAPSSAPTPKEPAAPGAAPDSGSSLVPTVDRDPLEGGDASDAASAPTPATAAPSPAGAAPSPSPAPKRSPPQADEDEDLPPAHDTVGGHLAVGAEAGYAMPFGSVDSKLSQGDVIGPGLFLAGDITYGIGRTVMIGAYGEVGMLSGEGLYAEKDASTIAAGALIRYHLVQGLRFDPWMAYGIGFRRQKMGADSVTGLDWARVQLGGDWYASSNLGFGPMLELSMGTFLSASPGTLESKSVNAQFVVGGRVVFDSPGK